MMIKRLFTVVFVCCFMLPGFAYPPAGGQRLQGQGPGTAYMKDGVITAKAQAKTPGVVYFDFFVPFSGDLNGKALSFTASKEDGEMTRLFYVRAFNAANECIFGFYNISGILSAKPKNFLLIPGVNSHGMTWEAARVKKGADQKIAKLRIFIAPWRDNPGNHKFGVKLSDFKLVTPPAPPKNIDLLGIGARSAEPRSIIATRDANGKKIIICLAQDVGDSYLLLTDVESGKTKQYLRPGKPGGSDNFGSILTRKGLYFYSHSRGDIYSFDIYSKAHRALGRPDPKRLIHVMVCTESDDGIVYFGGYPQASITAYNPATGKFRNYGRMDPKEHYISFLVTDKYGYVYAGIGTAKANIVALDPVSGKVFPILPEEYRATGTARVYRGEDGYVYGNFGKFQARLAKGKIVALGASSKKLQKLNATRYTQYITKFDDGSRVVKYDFYKKELTLADSKGRLRILPFEYQSFGLRFTSIVAGPANVVYGSTCHPMHFTEYNTVTRKITDHGPNPIVGGGNFCNMATDGKKVYACEYSGGRLWEYDPAKPVYFHKNGFGYPLSMLVEQVSAKNGHVSAIRGGELLFFSGDKDGAEFTLELIPEKSGKQYLNCRFYEADSYGTVVIDFRGVQTVLDLQNKSNQAGKIHYFGPFDMKSGKPEKITFIVFSNRLRKSRAWFGISNIKLDSSKIVMLAKPGANDNPRILGRWKDLVTRPRAIVVHPDKKHVIFSGFANYGLTGGGFAIHDLSTGKNSEISQWLPGHSCIALRTMPNGDLVGGTSIKAPGGGYQIAKEAALFIIDWQTKKVKKHLIVPKADNIISVELWKDYLWALVADGRLLQVDLKNFKIINTADLSGYGTVQRNALLKSDCGRLFILQSRCISEVHPGTLQPVVRCIPKANISDGGCIVGNKLYFACGAQYASWDIPEKLQ